MPSIYKLAREAGLEPTKACCIDNSCFAQPVDAEVGVAKLPPFTPVAEAGVLSSAAPAAQQQPAASERTLASMVPAGLKNTVRDVVELLEDPKPYGVELFARQRPMTEVREFDANGFRTGVR